MEKIQAHIIGDIISSNTSEAHTLYKKSCFGEPIREKIQYSLSEALFLVEKGKMEIISKNKKILLKDLLKKFQRIDKRIQIKYPVFKDLRNKGYIIKTALKFGADFRVYDKGTKPGKKHAKWIVFTDNESNRISWSEFSSKNRVAHSTRKSLLLAIVDEENSISYYQCIWLRP
ncbi:tRNA-intron lyase [Candidatus Pacearchaeota archaeon]|jgi:tRNA-intron endonuclease|nr:tRNA-intron lyase [Candidatus Pacearchaeota archaeon]|tara:strand:- start:827 stop:1345 length:519 start_codon:yes stop_codon:yes gene_type:complete